MIRLFTPLSNLWNRLRNGPVSVVVREGEIEEPNPGSRKGGWVTLALFVVLLPAFAALAWAKAERHNSGHQPGKRDPAIFYHDQHAYLNAGLRMLESEYELVLPRHRTPGFSILMSWLYQDSDAYTPDSSFKDPRRVSEVYFRRAKMANIFLAMLSVVALYGFCRWLLPPLESHLVTWGYAWLIAVIKAPYVQPEVMFYVLFLFSLVLLWQLIVKPRWWQAPAAAIVLAGAFILKSTVLPLIVLFLGGAVIRLVFLYWNGMQSRNPAERRAAIKWFACALIVPAGFAVILSPYFVHTAKLYGSPLWDVHSRHYLWMNDDAEKRFWRAKGISEPDFEPPPGKEPPSSKTWFADRGFSDVVERVSQGWKSNLPAIHNEYGGIDRLLWRLGFGFLAVLIVARFTEVRLASTDHWIGWLIISGFFIGYSLLYCWYSAIGVGPRLFLALYLPAWFFSVLGIYLLAKPLDIKIKERRIPIRYLFSAIGFLYILIAAVGVATREIWIYEGGR